MGVQRQLSYIVPRSADFDLRTRMVPTAPIVPIRRAAVELPTRPGVVPPSTGIRVPAELLRRIAVPGTAPALTSPFSLTLQNPNAGNPYVTSGIGRRIIGLTEGQRKAFSVPDVGDIPASKEAAERAKKQIDKLLAGDFNPAMAAKILAEGEKFYRNYKQRAAALIQAADAAAKKGDSLLASTLRKQAAAILKTKGGASWDSLQRMVYVYMSGKSKLLGDLLKKNPWLAQAAKTMKAGIGVTDATLRLVRKLSTKTEIDAGGIVDIAALSFNALNSAIGLAVALKLVPTGTASQVVGWTGVATSCASAVLTGVAAGTTAAPGMGTAIGGVLGTVACGMSVINQAFSTETKTPDVPPVKEPRAIYAPNEEQSPYIVTDAARLASVFRYWYGVPSLAEMFLRSGWSMHLMYLQYGTRPPRWIGDTERPDGYYPGQPGFDRGTGKFGKSDLPIPAPTLVDVLAFLESVDTRPFRVRRKPSQHRWPSSAWADLGAHFERTIQPLMKSQGYDESDMWQSDVSRDLPVSQVYREAAHWRHELASGRPTFGYIKFNERRAPWATSAGFRLPSNSRFTLVDGRSFLRLTELIDYFAAITVEENRLGLNPINAFLHATGFPVRQMARGAGAKRAYLATKWTDFKETERWLSYAPGPKSGDHSFPTTQRGIFLRKKKNGQWNWPVLRILGAMRVRAAMAYMISAHHWYIWSEKKDKRKPDMIKDLPALSAGGPKISPYTHLFLRGPDIRQFYPHLPSLSRIRAQTEPWSHRDKWLYSLRARPSARLTGGDPAAALAAILKAHNEKLRPILSQALTDVAYDLKYPALVVAKGPALIAKGPFPPGETTLPGSGSWGL